MSLDILHGFTKPEIIQWVREKAFARVRKSDLLFIRWQKASKLINQDYQQELDRWEASKPDFVQRDNLARQHNECKDPQERLRILEKLRPYDTALQQHLARCKKLDQRQDRVDRLYKQYENQRGLDYAQEQGGSDG
ncbi:hypothetical protein [Allopusillimonas ginsengisoli]|uniref:hypothetical protein n=1 Tax=Allopusillimonas ginsengisoli TaxID=453575 RepID=UPI00101FEA42|nr:hypothetical protein [Allopusillimonas ginsengisoli]TEA79802.1 hypothetical protein ERE07_02350 [Allopusillimonas ginsengisoli]